MITDVSRYMITSASVVVLDAGADREMETKIYWCTVKKVKGHWSSAMNQFLYRKPRKNAVYRVLDFFFRRRDTLIINALGVSVYYEGEKGSEITPEGCEQKLKEYLECLQSIVLFHTENPIRTEGENDEGDSNMRISRNTLLEMITNECHFIKMSQEYKGLDTRRLQGELTAMQVTVEKANAWREIGNYLQTMQLNLQEVWANYCLDLLGTFSNGHAGDTVDIEEFLRIQQAPEANTWTVPPCLRGNKY